MENKLWEFTDDILAGIIVLAWIGGKASGTYEIPESVLGIVLGYVFGKNMPKSE